MRGSRSASPRRRSRSDALQVPVHLIKADALLDQRADALSNGRLGVDQAFQGCRRDLVELGGAGGTDGRGALEPIRGRAGCSSDLADQLAGLEPGEDVALGVLDVDRS